jgi:acetoin utilization deacetylase AcuC-like enzyme
MFERIYSAARLSQLRTDRKLLLDVYELGDHIKLGAKVTDEDEEHILNPLRRQVSGLILGARLAYTSKSIVVVPHCGHHHASPSVSEGAGVFADVPLAWLLLRDQITDVQSPKALYIDVDVHHANGFARSRIECDMQEHFFMIDLYNEDIWPFPEDGGTLDTVQHVNIPVPFHSGIGNKAYLSHLRDALKRAETDLPPVNIVFYNCSNDAMMGDPLGKTNITERAVYERDRMVVEWARARDLPVVLMPSRGYGPSSCRVIRESMARLNDEYKIF